MEIIDKVAWIHIRHRRLLGVRSVNRTLAYLPGGKRDVGESDEACLQREITEELAVSLRPDSLRWMGSFRAQADGKPDGVYVSLACYAGDYDGELRASAEIAEFMWLQHADRDRCSAAAQQVIDALVARDLID